MITIYDLAEHLLGREPRNGADYEEAGLPIMGGCSVCGACIAAYNACPSRSGYLKCASGCITGDGYDTPLAAKLDLIRQRVQAAGDEELEELLVAVSAGLKASEEQGALHQVADLLGVHPPTSGQ